MRMTEAKSQEEEERFLENVREQTVECKCGKRVFIGIKGRRICGWCGNLVFKDKKAEFEFRMQEQMRHKK